MKDTQSRVRGGWGNIPQSVGELIKTRAFSLLVGIQVLGPGGHHMERARGSTQPPPAESGGEEELGECPRPMSGLYMAQNQIG